MQTMAPSIALRPARPEDTAFQQAVYASTRADELALVDWSPDQKMAFVLMQFNAQATHYSNYYPGAESSIILRNETPVGRLIVDRSGDEILLMDIALLPEHRHGGIGTCLIQALMAEARQSGKALRLYVETFNLAQRLYRRLGFTLVNESGIYGEMEWRPAPEGENRG